MKLERCWYIDKNFFISIGKKFQIINDFDVPWVYSSSIKFPKVQKLKKKKNNDDDEEEDSAEEVDNEEDDDEEEEEQDDDEGDDDED